MSRHLRFTGHFREASNINEKDQDKLIALRNSKEKKKSKKNSSKT